MLLTFFPSLGHLMSGFFFFLFVSFSSVYSQSDHTVIASFFRPTSIGIRMRMIFYLLVIVLVDCSWDSFCSSMIEVAIPFNQNMFCLDGHWDSYDRNGLNLRVQMEVTHF